MAQHQLQIALPPAEYIFDAACMRVRMYACVRASCTRAHERACPRVLRGDGIRINNTNGFVGTAVVRRD